jgi:hypothetical protein
MSRVHEEMAKSYVAAEGEHVPHLTPAQEEELNGRAVSGDVNAMGELANYSYYKNPSDSTLAIFWHAKAMVESRGAAIESKNILSGSMLPHRVVVHESEGNSHLTREQILAVIIGVSLAGNRLAESSSNMISEMTRVSAAELSARDLVEIYQNLIGHNKDNFNSDSGHKIREQIAGKVADDLGCDCRGFFTNRYEPYKFIFELRSRDVYENDLATKIRNFGVGVGVDAVKEDGFLPCLIDLTPMRERRPGDVVEGPSAGRVDMTRVEEFLVGDRITGGGGRY